MINIFYFINLLNFFNITNIFNIANIFNITNIFNIIKDNISYLYTIYKTYIDTENITDKIINFDTYNNINNTYNLTNIYNYNEISVSNIFKDLQINVLTYMLFVQFIAFIRYYKTGDLYIGFINVIKKNKDQLLVSKYSVKLWNIFMSLLSLLLLVNSFIYMKDISNYNYSYNYNDNIVNINYNNLNNELNFLLSTKIIEWIDTFFIVINGRDLIFLHYYHHATIVPLFKYGMLTLTHSAQWLNFINSFIHFFMYMYYSNPKFFKIIKIYITKLQIIQFTVFLILAYIPIYYEEIEQQKILLYACNTYVFSLLLLFIIFYFRKY